MGMGGTNEEEEERAATRGTGEALVSPMGIPDAAALFVVVMVSRSGASVVAEKNPLRR